MEKKTYGVKIVAILVIITLGILFITLSLRQKNKNPDINITDKFEAENFSRAIDLNGNIFAQCKGEMLGAVVPHHMIGGKFIADVFSQAKDIDTVILIGPNHFEKGASAIITSNSDWITAKGKVPVDGDFVGGMVSKRIAFVQNEVIKDDHSIGSIMPFIAYYLPNAKVIPIILKRNILKNDLENLVQYIINRQKNSRALIVGSVDFSHYLTASASKKKDKQTIKAIKDKNYDLISTFNNDNMDSPPSINAILKITESLGSNEMLWRNSNSFEVLDADINNTTSYFELVFCKNER